MNGFKYEGQTVLSVGDINKILVSRLGVTTCELVLACRNGLYFVNISLDMDDANILGHKDDD